MDAHLVDKRLAWIEAACERLRRLAVPDRIASDELQRAFVEHMLQTAIQAAIDIAAWIQGERKLGEPNSTRSMFRLLAQDGWVGSACRSGRAPKFCGSRRSASGSS